MIDVKKTILRTLINKFDRLRFLGDNDTKAFKKTLQLIILDDLYDWSDYLNDSQAVQKKLKDLRLLFIQCNPEFEICRAPLDGHYVNVNLPDEGIINDIFQKDIDTDSIRPIDPEPGPQPIPEKCGEPTVVFFTGSLPEPETLTACDKMNIYVNKITGDAHFLDTNSAPNEWKKINGGGSSATIPDYLLSYTNDENLLKIKLDDQSSLDKDLEGAVPITDSNISDNTDLNDVL